MSSDGETEQRGLMCELTEPDLIKRGEEMAECELEIDKLKETRKGINGTIAKLSTRRNNLATIIEDREEERQVICKWIEDVKQNRKDLVRQDNGAIVDTRPLTAADLQTSLDGIGPGDSDEDEDEDDDDDETVEVVSAGATKPANDNASATASRKKAVKGGKAAKRSAKASNGKATRHAHA